MIKAVVFDLDGVLIDSKKYQYKAFCKLFEKYGLKYKKTEFKWIGKTSIENIKFILQKNNFSLYPLKLANNK